MPSSIILQIVEELPISMLQSIPLICRTLARFIDAHKDILLRKTFLRRYYHVPHSFEGLSLTQMWQSLARGQIYVKYIRDWSFPRKWRSASFVEKLRSYGNITNEELAFVLGNCARLAKTRKGIWDENDWEKRPFTLHDYNNIYFIASQKQGNITVDFKGYDIAQLLYYELETPLSIA